MNISMSLALTMAGAPTPPSRTSSLRRNCAGAGIENKEFTLARKEVSLYKGISNRPSGWRSRKSKRKTATGSTAMDMNMQKFDGIERTVTDWDGLRRDPELWFSDGDCLVYLYAKGTSNRGPAFRVPVEAILASNCNPLLNKYLAQESDASPISELSSDEDADLFVQPSPGSFAIYIPAPPNAEPEEALLYHMATRNFFAWLFEKSLVGTHLGGALVGLLNTMNEFRAEEEDNVQAIMDYMDEEGYADMRHEPQYALGILFFAEYFQFRDLYIDAFVHCVGMHEKLYSYSGFEAISRTSRALLSRSKLEMGARLDHCGRRLASFLSDDLSEKHLGLPSGARGHLDKFRTFLQSYYVAKLGYYPPASPTGNTAAFPKIVYEEMCLEFENLYDYLVDEKFTVTDSIPPSALGGICVIQNVEAFNLRHKYPSLLHPLPLLPEVDEKPPGKQTSGKVSLGRRLSFMPKPDKTKPDPRLVKFSAVTKASHRHDEVLYNCHIVRAYRGFERDCIFSPEKDDKLSLADARKVRWILIYAMLQVLREVTRIPVEVRDEQNVAYNLCALTAGCPPWKEENELSAVQSPSSRSKDNVLESITEVSNTESATSSPSEIISNIDYTALKSRPQHSRTNSGSSDASVATADLKKGTVTQALSASGTMPELRHPRPLRNSFHDILGHNYGNRTNPASLASAEGEHVEQKHHRQLSSDSGSSSMEDASSGWSHSTGDDSPRTSMSGSRQGSNAEDFSKTLIVDFLDRPSSAPELGLRRMPSTYSVSIYDERLEPTPLQVKKNVDGSLPRTEEMIAKWEDEVNGKANDDLLEYYTQKQD